MNKIQQIFAEIPEADLAIMVEELRSLRVNGLLISGKVRDLARRLHEEEGLSGALDIVKNEVLYRAAQLWTRDRIRIDWEGDGRGVPSWATSVTDGKLVCGAHLETRNGQRVGNAHIMDIDRISGREVFHILTDAGTQLLLWEEEILEFYHRPRFVSDVAEVARLFERKDKDAQ